MSAFVNILAWSNASLAMFTKHNATVVSFRLNLLYYTTRTEVSQTQQQYKSVTLTFII